MLYWACSVSRGGRTLNAQAQYNIAYPVAAALIDGEVGPRQVMPPRIFDEDIRTLLATITTEPAAEYESAFPAKTYADVQIETVQGATFFSGRMEPRWEPPDDLPTDEQLQAKFHRLAGPVLGESRSGELQRLIWNFEQQPRADVLIRLCQKRP